MASNRERALEAAIELLASEGMRSLTHLRVDRQAGLPKGSTSNVFRTRDALVAGVTRHMVQQELPAVTTGFRAATEHELTASLIDLFAQLVGAGRMITAARLALFVEGAHDEAVRETIREGRADVQSPILPAFAALGAPDPAFATALLTTCFEGLLLQVLGSFPDLDPAPIIAATVRAGLTYAPEAN